MDLSTYLNNVDSLTAAETWKLAVETARTTVESQTQSKDTGLEYLALCHALALLDFPIITEDSSQHLLNHIRIFFTSGKKTAQIHSIAGDVAKILIQALDISKDDIDAKALIVSQAAIQISAAILSCMKRYPDLEKKICAAECLYHDWNSISQLHIPEILTALLPSDDKELTTLRSFNAIQSDDLTFVSQSKSCDSTLLLLNGRIQLNPSWNHFLQGYTDPDNSRELSTELAAQCWMSAIQNAPISWLKNYYQSTSPKRRQAIRLILAQKRHNASLAPIPDTDFESWLHLEASQEQAIINWLSRNLSDLKTASTISCFLNALIKRENHDPEWAHSWLKTQDLYIQTPDFWQLTNAESATFTDFYTFWLSQAWLENHQPDRAIHILQQRLTQSIQQPILYLQLARSFLALQDIGQAANSLEIPLSQTPITSIYPFGIQTSDHSTTLKSDIWFSAVNMIKTELGKLALQKAMHSPQPDEPLLELAMIHGEKNTFAEAALCWMDAGSDTNILAEHLITNNEGRHEWLKQILKRKSTNHLEKLYQIYLSISRYPHVEDIPEISLLEAASQLDDAYCASMTLERVLPKLSQLSSLYWVAVDLWIDLNVSMNQFDKAITPWIQPLSENDPNAIKAFKYLLISIPKSALGIIQHTLVEEIGVIQTKVVFESLKSAKIQQESTTTSPFSSENYLIDKLSSWLLPINWQILHQSSRLIPIPTPESQQRDAHKAQILKARGLVPPKTESAPEPAQWIHQSQPKASDAFD